ncbi:NAD-dependent epimerase/dehydratase family protein [Neolewinella antarctica]|uniref:UDP-glucuronate 4-epimerase n=1 Tax=Neolewinella antarctica TaxID=442734 RepID=A0ABX0XA44_9BACT|nr:NAD-dependent epimerase/dehydratase family protein [Neolewinella antarctica]NJC26097.1 UDP-glucuronate 4-epimerase [Neolewinella antarctica]
MTLVTGAAGFIGHHLINKLAGEGHEVIGIDNLNNYYDPQLKRDRLFEAGIDRRSAEAGSEVVSTRFPNYRFRKLDLTDGEAMRGLFAEHPIRKVCNLAAQAGVRYSITNPQAYVAANVTGFVNVLENCRAHNVEHLVYASSSSVYGLNEKIPFSENDPVARPVSLYAATKISNELMAHTYSHLYNLPTTGLRFFTVYGPWGRPDMAYSLFSDAILNDRPINVFNQGKMSRDFTYVGDIVDGVERVLTQPRPVHDDARHRIYNIGNGQPVSLLNFIELLENQLGCKAKKNYVGMQRGDVEKTFADTSALQRDYDYRANTNLEEGISSFVNWYLEYYQLGGVDAGAEVSERSKQITSAD